MLDGETERLETITSEFHNENTDLGAMFTYFSTHVPHSSVILQGNLSDMNDDMQEIAAGADI